MLLKRLLLCCAFLYFCVWCVNCSSNKVPSLETEVTERSFVIAMHSLPFDLIRFGGVHAHARTNAIAISALALTHSLAQRNEEKKEKKNICIYIRQSRSHRVNDMVISYSGFRMYYAMHRGWNPSTHTLLRARDIILCERQSKCPLSNTHTKK